MVRYEILLLRRQSTRRRVVFGWATVFRLFQVRHDSSHLVAMATKEQYGVWGVRNMSYANAQ